MGHHDTHGHLPDCQLASDKSAHISLGNGLSSVRYQAIIWTNVGVHKDKNTPTISILMYGNAFEDRRKLQARLCGS